MGDFPVITAGVIYIDSDKDGMSDKWETRHFLNPLDIADANRDADGDGYTNVEEFLNGSIPNVCIITESRVVVLQKTIDKHPNPCKGELYIKSILSDHVRYEIRSLEGKVLLQVNLYNQVININPVNAGFFVL